MLRQLEYLIAVSEFRNFHIAAKKLGVSQPTLSGQLRSLEKDLGVVLVDRTRGRVGPTEIGHEVISFGRRMLSDAQGLRDTCRAEQQRDKK